ncbi:polysaccharide deacetylase family protein [Curtobacterium sp. MCBD17_003]|uniref:polysaccharide deacetylase family protein n=1 Tax=Curtobacterium sp. MCBD17_003 TaxID=2175667 RepID=UPI001C649CBC|nr:polysaccharide deacetylase family protein [Curtobacterium sp. MCBD17_003]WIE55293.1 polysaccharide deacetylase family protein [Curtobacterium sp. MCBD17_003]
MSEIEQQEPWRWPEEVWRGHVERVRAGRSLLPAAGPGRWPDGARVAVAISFDSDHETPALRDGETSPGRMAQGEYGARAAVPRILELLDRYEAPSSFYMPAVCALLRPDEAPTYVEHGHEVAVHGWIHERNTLLAHDDELDLLGRAMEVLESQTGVRPTGIRTPSWDFSDSTLDVVRELGFTYDSSLMADDDPYEILQDGERTGIVEIPVD